VSLEVWAYAIFVAPPSPFSIEEKGGDDEKRERDSDAIIAIVIKNTKKELLPSLCPLLELLLNIFPRYRIIHA
jgi:hypothetical protein